MLLLQGLHSVGYVLTIAVVTVGADAMRLRICHGTSCLLRLDKFSVKPDSPRIFPESLRLHLI